MTEPSWVEHVIWWQVYPLGFVGAPIRDRPDNDSEVVHRLPHIEKWLDYAVELGASGLALGPLFSSSTHGYDTTDYLTIDPRLGDLDDFDALIAAAHQRGLKVMLDGVFNHVGQAFPRYQSALHDGPGGADQNWFHLEWDDSGTASHDAFEGHDELVTLNHREPAVVDMVVEVMSYWLGRGADSWRLDAAYAVSPSFWAQVLPRVRDKYPDAYFVGEVIHGDYEKIVGASGMDSVTQYELWKAIWSAITEKNFFELSWAIERHNTWLGDFVPLTFVGNHDVNRLASTVTDERHVPHAYVVLFTLGGTPSVYYGDEQAFRGIKEERVGGDDDVRPSFPQSPSELATFGDWAYRLHQELIGLRRRHPWLHRASAETVTLENELFMYRLAGDDEQLVVALNLGDTETRQKIKGVSSVVAGEAEYGNSYVTIPAHGWVILS